MTPDLTAEVAAWLVEVGYGFDWRAPDHPLPEAWHDHDAADETVEDYYALLAGECGWPSSTGKRS